MKTFFKLLVLMLSIAGLFSLPYSKAEFHFINYILIGVAGLYLCMDDY